MLLPLLEQLRVTRPVGRPRARPEAVLGDKALRAAINNYYDRSGQQDKVIKEESRIICKCMNVTDHEIEEAVLEGARTLLELQEQTKMSTVCGKCKDEAEILLKVYMKKHFG